MVDSAAMMRKEETSRAPTPPPRRRRDCVTATPSSGDRRHGADADGDDNDDDDDRNGSSGADGADAGEEEGERRLSLPLQRRIPWRRLWHRLWSIVREGTSGGGGATSAAVVALLFSLAFAHRYRRARRRRGTTRGLIANPAVTPPSSSSCPFWLLSNWLMGTLMRRRGGDLQRPRRPSDPGRTGRGAPPHAGAAADAPLSLLMSAARSGTVRRALVGGTSCLFQLGGVGGASSSAYSPSSASTPASSDAAGWLRSTIPNGMDLSTVVSALVENGCADVADLPPSLASKLATPAIAVVPFAYLGLMYGMLKKLQDGHDGMLKGGGDVERNSGVGVVRTRFSDVAGVDGAKMELMEVVQCLREPSRYRAVGALPPRGVLLHGPSGTGKTLLARAVAGEAGARADADGGDHRCCAFLSCSASDFVEMLVGRGAARIRDLFDRARAEARALDRRGRRRRGGRGRQGLGLPLPRTGGGGDDEGTPPPSAVIFIDEIDALAKCRTGGLHGNDEREQTLNQLLTEMDGFDSGSPATTGDGDRDGERGVTLVVLAATNRPEILDPALLRPGRFDRHVYVGCPDAAGREAILRLHGRRVKMDPAAVDLVELAGDGLTGGFSGADLANVVNESAFLAVRRGQERVTQEHLVEAARRVSKMKVHLGTEHDFGRETAYDVF